MTVLPTETVVQQLRHEVRVVHATTGDPIAGFVASLVHPRRPGWTTSKSGHRVIVSVIDRHHDAAIVPRLALQVTDPMMKSRLAPFGAPAGVPNPDLYHQITVDLSATSNAPAVDPNAPIVDVSVHPVVSSHPMLSPLHLTVVRLRPAPSSLHLTVVDRSGVLQTGRTVELHGTAAAVLPLVEGAPGVYEALEQIWTADFATCDVVIDAIPDRTLTIDPNIRVIRVRLIAT